MEESPKSYTDQLLEWGRKGSFYPNLIPDNNESERIRQLQFQLQRLYPTAKPEDNLHVTLFYIKPKVLFDQMKKYLGKDVKEEWLYMDLTTIFATYMLCDAQGLELQVSGLRRFGSDNSVLALELIPTKQIESIRQLFEIAIRRNGADDNLIATLKQNQEFEWILAEDYRPHLSLLTQVSGLDVPNYDLPKSVKLSLLGDGSVKAPSLDRAQWYIMPMSNI